MTEEVASSSKEEPVAQDDSLNLHYVSPGADSDEPESASESEAKKARLDPDEPNVEPPKLNEKDEDSVQYKDLLSLDPATALKVTLQGCMRILSCRSMREYEGEHSKTTAEVAMSNFCEMARRLEVDFAKKEIMWTALKPEMALEEEIRQLKIELARKDHLLQKLKGQTNIMPLQTVDELALGQKEME